MLKTTANESRRLRSTGWGRWFDAAFLSFWLVFWVVGEVVALVMVVAMFASALSAALGRPLALASRVAPTDGSVSFFLLFMLLWAALWTVGGVAAATHLLRRLAGADLIELTAEGLHLEWRAGPVRRRRGISRSSVRRVRMRSHDKAVVLDTVKGTVLLSDLGTSDERVSLKDWIAQRLAPPASERARLHERETPPRDRDVESQGFDTIVTHPTRRARAIGTRVMWALAAIVSLGWIGALRHGGASVGTTAASATGVLTMIVAFCALWVMCARTEWVVRPGHLHWRFCFWRWTLREQPFDTPATLEIEHQRDSDGDDRYALVIRSDTRRQVLSTAIHDRYELAALGEWLAGRTGFTLKGSSAL
jgi:hypothetical protein